MSPDGITESVSDEFVKSYVDVDETVDEDALDDGVACLECAVKHVAAARVEYSEYLQNNESYLDLIYCIGDLACAERHILSYDKDIAEMVRQVRKCIQTAAGITLGKMDCMVSEVCAYAGLFKDRNGK